MYAHRSRWHPHTRTVLTAGPVPAFTSEVLEDVPERRPFIGFRMTDEEDTWADT